MVLSSTAIRFCLTLLLLPVLMVLSISAIPVMIIAAILRKVEACIYDVLYNAKVFLPVDFLWTMGSKENPLDIKGCMILDGELSIDKFRTRIDENLLQAKREYGERIYWQVTKYIVSGYINYYWFEEDKFDICEHVYQLSTELITSENELKEILRKGSTREIPKKSPWEFILIPYVECGNRKTVIHIRMAHAIADGVSLIYFLLFRLGDSEHLIDQSQLRMPRYLQRNLFVLLLEAIWRLPMMSIENLVFKKEINAFDNVLLTGDKYICWSKPLDLKSIKDIKNKLGTTINDVILGCCAKSFNDLFHEVGEYCPKQLSIATPFNMRFRIDEAKDFKNMNTGLSVKLPTGQSDLKSCIKEINHFMDDIKSSCQPYASLISWKVISYILIPEYLCKKFVLHFLQNVSLGTSYLVAPQQQIGISGHLIDSITYWAPTPPTMAACVCFCCYNDKLRIGIETDSALFVDADKLIEILERNINSIANI